jgi:hypothetical protein
MIIVFWDVTPCSFVDRHQHFASTSLHFYRRRVSSCLKFLYLFTKLHDVTAHKSVLDNTIIFRINEYVMTSCGLVDRYQLLGEVRSCFFCVPPWIPLCSRMNVFRWMKLSPLVSLVQNVCYRMESNFTIVLEKMYRREDIQGWEGLFPGLDYAGEDWQKVK